MWKCQLRHPPGILLWGSLERSWKRWVMRTFRRISRLGVCHPTKIASSSRQAQNSKTRPWWMRERNATRVSRGCRLNSLKWMKWFVFIVGYPPLKDISQRITCFYKNLGPRARKILCQIVKEQSVHILVRVPIYLHYWIHWHHGTNIHLKLFESMDMKSIQWELFEHSGSTKDQFAHFGCKCDGFHQIHPVTPVASVFVVRNSNANMTFLLWTYSIPSRELTYVVTREEAGSYRNPPKTIED